MAVPRRIHEAAQRRAEKAQPAPPPARDPAVNHKAFAVGLSLLRAAYAVQVEAIAELLRPRIQAGEFGDLSTRGGYGISSAVHPDEASRLNGIDALTGCIDGSGFLEIEPGSVLLERALRSLTLPGQRKPLVSGDFAAGVRTASDREYSDGWVSPDDEAVECLAADVTRIAFKRGWPKVRPSWVMAVD